MLDRFPWWYRRTRFGRWKGVLPCWAPRSSRFTWSEWSERTPRRSCYRLPRTSGKERTSRSTRVQRTQRRCRASRDHRYEGCTVPSVYKAKSLNRSLKNVSGMFRLKNLACKMLTRASSLIYGQWLISNNLHPQGRLCILLVVFEPILLWLSQFSLIQWLPDVLLLWTQDSTCVLRSRDPVTLPLPLPGWERAGQNASRCCIRWTGDRLEGLSFQQGYEAGQRNWRQGDGPWHWFTFFSEITLDSSGSPEEAFRF